MAKIKQPIVLPRVPSQLIEIALADLEKVEKSKLYRVDMSDWHKPNGKCAVCLAGAVMAKTLGVDRALFTDPWGSHVGDNKAQLVALNEIREGGLEEAFAYLEIDDCPIEDREITPYETNPELFKSDMRQLAADLREVGL